MVKKVKWQQKALLEITQIAGYLENEYSLQTAHKFVDIVYHRIEFLIIHPEIGRKSAKFKTVQFIRIDKYRQLFYRVNSSILYIVDIWDTRQNPKNRPY